VAVAACTNQSNTASVPDEALSRDLAIAASEAVELAPQGSGYALYAAEIAPPSVTLERSSSVPKPSPRKAPTPEPVSAAPGPIVAIAEEMRLDESPVGLPVETERPAPARRPAPIPVDFPVSGDGPNDGHGNGPNEGEGRGPVIGVVIRGGGVGHDDCAIHRRPGVGGTVMVGAGSPIGIARGPIIRGGVAINDRMPRRTPGTFPR
jgi:hypothetical protein